MLSPFPEGRLQQATLDLLAGSDIQFRRETRLDIALVKNHPIALVFLPAADIPTFVGEGRVDLGITGGDQVAEHEANLMREEVEDTGEGGGVEEVLGLGFGKCWLQVQVPEKGNIRTAEELVGRNVVTSFVGLTEQYFARLEGQQKGRTNGDVEEPLRKRLKTKIKYVGGSVEAACALGVADGIVDLVGKAPVSILAGIELLILHRIRRNDESRRPKSHRHSRQKHSRTHKIKTPFKSKTRRYHRGTDQRRHRCFPSPHLPPNLP